MTFAGKDSERHEQQVEPRHKILCVHTYTFVLACRSVCMLSQEIGRESITIEKEILKERKNSITF